MDTAPPSDPVKLLETLDAEAIQERLDALDREARALRVLLRSARARQGAMERRRGRREEAAHVE
jgi:hypothetical protein